MAEERQIKKEWWKSRTIWAALASLVVAIATAMLGESDPLVSTIIAVLSAVGLYGRTVASGPVAWKRKA